MQKAKLLLLSNQLILSEALAGLLNDLPGFRVVGHTAGLHEALALAGQAKPQLLLADIELPETMLREVSAKVHAQLPEVSLVFFGSLSCKQRLLDLISLPAKGYLTTDMSLELFGRLLNDALLGSTAISPAIMEEVLAELRVGSGQVSSVNSTENLTAREKEVLQHLISGATNREIANSLVISEYTVKNHIHNMLEKLQIQNRAQLISYALTKGFPRRSLGDSAVRTYQVQ